MYRKILAPTDGSRLSQRAVEQAEALFADIRRVGAAAGVSVETVLVEAANVYRQIIAVARKRRCDLICMASHGRRGLSALVLGSEATKVLTHSKLPVLVLR